MEPFEIVARFCYEHAGVLDRHSNRTTVPYEQAEYSAVGRVQDAFFRSTQLANALLEQLADHGYVVRKRHLEPVE